MRAGRLSRILCVLLCAAFSLAVPALASATPFTNLGTLPALAPAGWTRGDVQVRLAGSDDTSPTATVQTGYSLDAGAPRTYDATLSITEEGVHVLRYWSVDSEGRSETTKTAIIRIDRTAPESVSTVSGAWVRMVPLRLYSYDALSGIADIRWRFDDGEWHTGAGVSTPSVDAHTLSFRAIDGAGNVEPTQTLGIQVDATAPVTACLVVARYTGTASIRLSPTDAQSGVAETRWSRDGRVWYAGRTAFLPLPGTYVLCFRSLDRAGNAEPVRSKKITVVKRAVTISKSPRGSVYLLLRRSGVANWRFSATFKMPSGAPIVGKRVLLQKSTNGVTWTTAYTLVTTQYGSASKTLRFTRAGTTYWRWRSPSTSMYSPANSTTTKVAVR